MKRNNKALYERIMRNVSREVKKALTESMITESWGGLNAADDAQWNEWWEEYVPSKGKCDTVGGEIMRAMSRIVYRYYNDGDTVEEYYGSEKNLCRGADYYLQDHIPGYKSLGRIWNQTQYEKELCDRLKFVFDYLNATPDVFNQPNNENYLDLAPYEPIMGNEEDYYDPTEEDEY